MIETNNPYNNKPLKIGKKLVWKYWFITAIHLCILFNIIVLHLKMNIYELVVDKGSRKKIKVLFLVATCTPLLGQKINTNSFTYVKDLDLIHGRVVYYSPFPTKILSNSGMTHRAPPPPYPLYAPGRSNY